MELDSTVRSQNSNDSKGSKDSKPESCSVESKHSKEILIIKSEKEANGAKDDSNLLMFTSCGQLLLGVVLVVFGVLVLVHGASLGGSGAGLWAGAGALVAGALGVVATLATSTNSSKTTTIPQPTSGFATAHLASSLVALALSNMAAITALTAVVRDSQRTPELTLLETMDEDGSVVGVERGWAGLLASIGLLIASVAELIISAHSCVTLAPRLCGCLRSSPSTSSPSATTKDGQVEGQLKTHNMVHQWVTAQTHNPKSQQIYLVQPVMPMQTMLQTPYGMSTVPGKYPGGLIPAGTMPPPSAYHHPPGSMITAVPSGYKVARGPHPLRSPNHPPNYHPQMIRVKRKRYVVPENELETASRRRKQEMQPQSKAVKKMLSAVGEDQVDMAHTYTGLDKRISEEFIAIAMDPDRKSKASSNNGSEIGSGLGKPAEGFAHSKL